MEQGPKDSIVSGESGSSNHLEEICNEESKTIMQVDIDCNDSDENESSMNQNAFSPKKEKRMCLHFNYLLSKDLLSTK